MKKGSVLQIMLHTQQEAPCLVSCTVGSFFPATIIVTVILITATITTTTITFTTTTTTTFTITTTTATTTKSDFVCVFVYLFFQRVKYLAISGKCFSFFQIAMLN